MKIRHGWAVGLVAVLLGSSSARAQTGPELLLGSFEDDTNAIVRGDAYFLDKGHTDSDEAIKLDIYQASGRFKLDLDGIYKGINRAQPRAGYQVSYLNLGANDAGLPEHLTDMSAGVGLGILKNDKWLAGLSVAVGYASATTFGDANAFYGKADLGIGYTINENERIGFILDYDGNRTFLPDIPLPGFLYRRRYSDEFSIGVGFPYSEIDYKPTDKITLHLRYSIPDSGEAEIDYAITDPLHVYAGFSQQNEAFKWNALSNGNDRLIFNQSRVEIGLRGKYDTFGKDLNFTIAGGYAFSTQFDYGYDSRDTDHVADLSDEPYLRVGFELNF